MVEEWPKSKLKASNMEITVKLNNIRKSPRKIRPCLYGIKGKNTTAALDILRFSSHDISRDLSELIKSGIAAAKEHEMDENKLFVKILKCDTAGMLKRHIFVSKGRSSRIHKRNSHLTLTLSDQQITPNKKSKVMPAQTKSDKPKSKVIKESNTVKEATTIQLEPRPEGVGSNEVIIKE